MKNPMVLHFESEEEKKDFDQIMDVYHKKIENDDVVLVTNIVLDPFEVQYPEATMNDKPFTLVNTEKIVLEIGANPNVKELNLKDRIKYTNSDYDITLIELKAEDNISDFLELDDIIVDDIISGKNKNEVFIDEDIYIKLMRRIRRIEIFKIIFYRI